MAKRRGAKVGKSVPYKTAAKMKPKGKSKFGVKVGKPTGTSVKVGKPVMPKRKMKLTVGNVRMDKPAGKKAAALRRKKKTKKG